MVRSRLRHGGAQGHAHVGLGDLGARVRPLGQGLDDTLGLGPVPRRTVDRYAAARRLDQHLEGVLDQGDVAAVGTDHGSQGLIAQGQELGLSRH
ncbi:hypothetical protein D3C81_1754150 [compost metagenome]